GEGAHEFPNGSSGDSADDGFGLSHKGGSENHTFNLTSSHPRFREGLMRTMHWPKHGQIQN
ncbi:MAG: hypothetical protein ACPHJE_03945, partial [Poseidonia sp.]